jgi:glycosyltransferase involved in cell wall biosynthesis
MNKVKRIFIVADINYNPVKLFLDQTHKLAKGLMCLGNDARIFSYCGALRQLSPLKSKKFSKCFYKSKVDQILARQIKNYQPHIICISFARFLDVNTIKCIRQAAPNAVFIGGDGDPWPKRQKGRLDTAKELDILMATNDGQFLQGYRDVGVPLCVFMPNMCDPDIDHRYDVSSKWRTDILWTGKAKHHADTSETLREEIVTRLIQRENCTIYGSCGRPQIGGFDYLYAISGARMGVNVNAVNSVRLYHSDRLTHYLACGTFVLAKRVPDTDLLFKDGVHIKYFDTAEELFDLADWYLKHETERKKVADAGMRHTHEQFNCVKMAGYILELVEKGSYNAPWTC